MTTEMRIDRVSLAGVEGDAADFSFREGINVVHGETGSGKTSLLELVKYVLGGNASLSQAVQEGVKSASVTVRLGESAYVFRRGVGETVLRAEELDGTVLEELAVNKRKHMRRASEFLLDATQLPRIKLSSQRSGRHDPVSFWDYYPYIYLRQAEIDRSVVNHLDTWKDRKRKAVFELLLGLSSVEVAELRNARDAAMDEHRTAQRELASIERFLDGLDLPSGEQLEQALTDIGESLDSAHEEMQELRKAGRIHTQDLDARQSALREALQDLNSLGKRTVELEARLEARVASRFELESERERTTRGGTATDLLGTLEFHQCPRCLQSVEAYRYGEDQCYLCGQEEPQPDVEDDSDDGVEDEIERIDQLLAEVDQLIEEDRAELDRLLARKRGIQLMTRDLSRELDEVSAEYVSPLFEQIAAIGERIGRLRQSQEALTVQNELWRRQELVQERMEGLESEISDYDRELRSAEGQVEASAERLRELSGVFDDIVRTLDMPWYSEPARIDPDSYLPIVNGVTFEELSSGGMKMMTNVAYHLALLTHGLAQRDTRIPTLLIIDSPRKNLGATPEDLEHSRRFYRWIEGLVTAYTQDFQLIIADNDPPPDDVRVSAEIPVSHANPVVPGLEHPGGEVDLIG